MGRDESLYLGRFIPEEHHESREIRLLEEILRVQEASFHELRKLVRLLNPHRTTQLGIIFTNGDIMPFSVVLTVGQSTTATIVPLEADGVTITPGATVSAQTFTLTDPSVTLTPNPDGTAAIKGIAASTAPVTGTVSATVTDADGTVSPLTQTFTVTVNAPTGRTTQLGVNFSTPA